MTFVTTKKLPCLFFVPPNVFFIFSLVIETIGEKKVFDTQIGKRKTSFGIYNINFDISPAFFAFVVNLIKRKLETVSIIFFFHQRLSLCVVGQLSCRRKQKLEFLQHKSFMESEIYANLSDFQVDSEDSNQ
jgi:hypothetical protein